MREIALRLRECVVCQSVHVGDAEAREAAEAVALEIEELTVGFAGLELGFGPGRGVEHGLGQIGAHLEG